LYFSGLDFSLLTVTSPNVPVGLKWRLHFEFVTTTTHISPFPQQAHDFSEPIVWTGPPSLEIETMVWDLPIKIFPASPVTVAQGLQLETEVVGKI
jgi:hypothetical protein